MILCLTGNDLNMACERARVAIDDMPPSPVTQKVRHEGQSLQCFLLQESHVSITHHYFCVCICSLIWKRLWPCSTPPQRCFTTRTAGGTLMLFTSVKAAQYSRLQRGTCWESFSFRWEDEHLQKWTSAAINTVCQSLIIVEAKATLMSTVYYYALWLIYMRNCDCTSLPGKLGLYLCFMGKYILNDPLCYCTCVGKYFFEIDNNISFVGSHSPGGQSDSASSQSWFCSGPTGRPGQKHEIKKTPLWIPLLSWRTECQS